MLVLQNRFPLASQGQGLCVLDSGEKGEAEAYGCHPAVLDSLQR